MINCKDLNSINPEEREELIEMLNFVDFSLSYEDLNNYLLPIKRKICKQKNNL